MGNLSLRDRAIMLSVVVLALYGLAAVLWFMKFQRDWTKSAKEYDTAVKTYQRERNLIGKRASLEEEKIPELEENELANVLWQRRLSAIADDSNLTVNRQNYGKEEQEGVLNKLEIDIEWTASLQSLVKFLHALETADHAMFDVRSIGISNSGKNTGYLKGKMTICCAYLRDDEEKGK